MKIVLITTVVKRILKNEYIILLAYIVPYKTDNCILGVSEMVDKIRGVIVGTSKNSKIVGALKGWL